MLIVINICNFICFLASILCTFLGCNGQYSFEMETIENTKSTFTNEVDPRIMRRALAAHPFNKLGIQEQRFVCLAAKEHASVDDVDPKKIGLEVRVDILGVLRTNGTNTHYIALICPTVPRLYLRLVDKYSIKIMQSRNYFADEHYEYDVQIIVSVNYLGGFDEDILETVLRAMSAGIDNPESQPNLPYLVYRRVEERHQICVAARKRIKYPPLSIISEEWTEKAAKYEIEYTDGRKKQVVAIACNSYPKIYVSTHEKIEGTFVVMILH